VARWIALLRGINLGPNRRVAMADLRTALEALGCADVRTHLQSGNVVLTSDRSAKELAAAIERAVEEGCGVPNVAVVVRSRDELADVVAGNPLPDATAQPKRFQVSFCSGEPTAAVRRGIEALAEPPEQVAFRRREIYAYHPDGIQRSALAKALADKRLGVTATARNWNTVTKMLELADG
jgi:uncharacterized protein (DUF1697 family)